MGLITHSRRFNIKRTIVSYREEENNKLLNRMQTDIDHSLSELKSGVDSMRILFENTKKMQDEQEEFRDHLRLAFAQSVKLVNFAGLLTDFGPQRSVKGLREINA